MSKFVQQFFNEKRSYIPLFFLCVSTLVVNSSGLDSVDVADRYNSNYTLGSQAQRCSLHQTLGNRGSLTTYMVSDGAAQLVHS